MARISRWFRRIVRQRQQSEHPSADAVDKALARDISAVSSQDPDTMGQWNLLRARIARSSLAPSPARLAQRRHWLKPATAIGFAGAAAALAIVLLWPRPATPLVYRTGIGQRSMVLLADSSEVTLNHNSELTVLRQDMGEGRRTTLTGEAFFKVRKTGEPFVVKTDFGSVEVLGTEFNVRMRRGEMGVAVVSGRVRVTASRGGKDSTVLLHPGEFTALARGMYPASPQRLPFAEDYPGWLHGKFLFDRTTLAIACREIADQFGVPVEIDSPKLAGKTITGVLDGRNIESAVKTLCLLSGASYRHENNGYTLH